MSDLIQQLNDLAVELRSNVQNINSGGCCVVAVNMYKKLKPLLGRKIRIEFILTGYVESTDHVKDGLREWKNITRNHNNGNLHSWLGMSCDHAYVVFNYNGDKYYFDTDVGAIPYREGRKMIYREYGDGVFTRMSFRVAEQMAATRIGWNIRFNRKQIPTLEQIIEQTPIAA